MDSATALVVGQRPDVHIDAVEAHLKGLGARAIVFDRNSADRCAIRFDTSEAHGWVEARSERVPLTDVSAVWWRVKPTSPIEFSGGTGTPAEAMRWAEW